MLSICGFDLYFGGCFLCGSCLYFRRMLVLICGSRLYVGRMLVSICGSDLYCGRMSLSVCEGVVAAMCLFAVCCCC